MNVVWCHASVTRKVIFEIKSHAVPSGLNSRWITQMGARNARLSHPQLSQILKAEFWSLSGSMNSINYWWFVWESGGRLTHYSKKLKRLLDCEQISDSIKVFQSTDTTPLLSACTVPSNALIFRTVARL